MQAVIISDKRPYIVEKALFSWGKEKTEVEEILNSRHGHWLIGDFE